MPGRYGYVYILISSRPERVSSCAGPDGPVASRSTRPSSKGTSNAQNRGVRSGLCVATVGLGVLPAEAHEPTLVRLAGGDRYGTAARLSAAYFHPPVDDVFIATGESFPDAGQSSPVDAGVLRAGHRR